MGLCVGEKCEKYLLQSKKMNDLIVISEQEPGDLEWVRVSLFNRERRAVPVAPREVGFVGRDGVERRCC